MFWSRISEKRRGSRKDIAGSKSPTEGSKENVDANGLKRKFMFMRSLYLTQVYQLLVSHLALAGCQWHSAVTVTWSVKLNCLISLILHKLATVFTNLNSNSGVRLRASDVAKIKLMSKDDPQLIHVILGEEILGMYCSLRCVGYVGGCLKEWINVYVYLRILSLGLQFLIAWFLRRLPLLLIWPLSNISYISFYYATSTSLELSSPGHWNHSQFSQWSHYACFCDNSWLRADFVVWEETYSVSRIYLTSHRTFEVQRLSLDAKLT